MPLYWADWAIETIVLVSAVTSAWIFVSESASGVLGLDDLLLDVASGCPETCSAAVRATPTIAEAEVSESPSFL